MKWLRLLVVLVVLCVGLHFLVGSYYHQSPEQLWRRLQDRWQELVQPKPSPSPSPLAPREPAATPEPTVAATPAPTPEKDPLAWVLERKERCPKEVRLVKAVDFPVVVGGRVAGTAAVAAGLMD